MTVISLFHKSVLSLSLFAEIVSTAGLRADVVFKSLNPTYVAEVVAPAPGMVTITSWKSDKE